MIMNPLGFNKKTVSAPSTFKAEDFKHIKLPLAIIGKIEAVLRRFGFVYRSTNEFGGIIYTKPMSDELNDQIVMLFCTESKEGKNNFPYVRFTYGKKDDKNTIKKFFEFKEIAFTDEIAYNLKEFIECRIVEAGNLIH